MIMRPSPHRCLAYTKRMFGLFEAWKLDSWDSWLKTTRLPLSNFSSFWRPDKAIPTVSLTPPLEYNWFLVGHFSTFCQHKYVILQGLWYPGNKGILFSLSYYWKFLRPWLKNTWITVYKFSWLCRPDNAIPALSWNLQLKGNWLQVRHS